MTDKQREFLQKIKALAEQGVGGEQSNAQRILDDLLEKHGITIEDLDLEKHEDHEIRHPAKHSYLANQIAWSVVKSHDRMFQYRYKNRTRFGIVGTLAEKLEIDMKIDFYAKLFDKEIEKLRYAFYLKHRLFGESDSDKDPTPEQLDEYLKAEQMSRSLENAEYQKRLEK